MDITYVPMARGFVYLCAVLDWANRCVLAHRIGITMEVDFCVEALEEAIAKYGAPHIMNTDQGAHFTSAEFIGKLEQHDIAISIDGRGRWRDNVFVERLWKRAVSRPKRNTGLRMMVPDESRPAAPGSRIV